MGIQYYIIIIINIISNCDPGRGGGGRFSRTRRRRPDSLMAFSTRLRVSLFRSDPRRQILPLTVPGRQHCRRRRGQCTKRAAAPLLNTDGADNNNILTVAARIYTPSPPPPVHRVFIIVWVVYTYVRLEKKKNK